MREIKFLLLVIILFCFSACKKNNNNNVPIDPTLKKYFSYKPGSYWVYYDSVSLAISIGSSIEARKRQEISGSVS